MSGMRFVFQQIADLADQELNDEDYLREQLVLLQVQLEDGDVEEDEFAAREADIILRLREIRARKLAALQETDSETRTRVIVETFDL
jgi:hypothetical protein